MKKLFYYPLIMAVAVSTVMFSSCTKDKSEDEPTPTPVQEQQKTFTVKINLNNNEVISLPCVEEININFDEIIKDEKYSKYFENYEILSITKDGKEISGSEKISENAEYNIEALKLCTLKAEMPAANKILYYEKVTSTIKKDAVEENNTTYTWYYKSPDKENVITVLCRIEGSQNYITHYSTDYIYSLEDGKLSNGNNGKGKSAIFTLIPAQYILKGNGKFYLINNRYKKEDKTVKGYLAKWGEGEAELYFAYMGERPSEEEGQKELQAENNIIIEKEGAEYNDGVITYKGNTYLYDGTYLYRVKEILQEIDIPTFASKTPVKYNKAPSNYSLVDNDIYIYENLDNYYYAYYDWNNDGEYDELGYTYVLKGLPFGNVDNDLTIFPDKKAYIDYTGFGNYEFTNIDDDNIFYYKGYYVFYIPKGI